MTTSMRIFSLLILSLALGIVGREARAENPLDLLIVANSTVPIDTITKDDLKQIFLKQRQTWPGGQKIIPLHVKGNPELRNRFRKIVLAMTAAKEKDYWEDQKMRSGLKDPPELKDVLKAAFRLKGSITYVLRKDYIEGVVKIVATFPAE